MKNNSLNKVYRRQPAYFLLRINKVYNHLFHPLHSSAMTFHIDTLTRQVHEQNISFYDEIAGQYDELLAKEASNRQVRQQVKELLLQASPTGTVLDFGGGTGLDLGWLTAHHYHIIFCEPSAGMREEAIRYNREVLQNDNIVFLENEQTDFTQWQELLPFSQPVDAVLANFGVLNAIPDINLLFHKLAPVVKPGGHLLAVILERPFKKMWQWHRRNALGTLFLGKPFVMYVWHKLCRQTVYVHTPRAVQLAAVPYFECRSCKAVTGTSFILLHLVRR